MPFGQNLQASLPALSALKSFDIGPSLDRRRLAEADAVERQKRSTLSEIGKFMASNNAEGAMNTAFGAGEIGVGLAIQDRQTQIAQAARELQEKTTAEQRAAEQKKVNAIATMASRADTPEKWGALQQAMAQQYPQSAQQFMETPFEARESIIAQSTDALELFKHIDKVSGADSPGGAGQFKTHKDRVQAGGMLRKEFATLTKPYRAVRDSYGRIEASVDSPSPAGDLALIFNYMKMLDPGSVVRESEFATAQNTGSVPERVRAQYNKTLRGERLSKVMRSDFKDRADKLWTKTKGQFEKTEGQYKILAGRLGFDPLNIIMDFSPPGAAAELPDPLGVR